MELLSRLTSQTSIRLRQLTSQPDRFERQKKRLGRVRRRFLIQCEPVRSARALYRTAELRVAIRHIEAVHELWDAWCRLLRAFSLLRHLARTDAELRRAESNSRVF